MGGGLQKSIICCLLGLAVAGIPSFVAAGADTRPNVVMILIDDLRDSLGCYGDEQVKTPVLDSFAKKAVLFERAYCQYALCGPSRSSLFTGRYPRTLRAFNNKTFFRDHAPNVISLPQHFKEHGYLTQGIGKILHDTHFDEASWTEPMLFENEKVYASDRFKGRVARIDGIHGENRELPLVECADVDDEAYRDGLATKQACDALASFSQQEKPFCLLLGYHKPHSPFCAPKKYWDLYQREDLRLAAYQGPPVGAAEVAYQGAGRYLRSFMGMPEEGPWPEQLQREVMHAYYACVSYIDAQVGKVLTQLEATGLAGNTIVVVTSDHGYQLGEHGLWCKHTNFENATRVPLIIFDPRREGEWRNTFGDLVELVDLAPTLWQLAELPEVPEVDGRSLLGSMQAEKAPLAFGVARSRFHRGGLWGLSVRTWSYRYTRWLRPKDGGIVFEELYDYEKDPEEKRNWVSSPEYTEVLGMMENLWLEEYSEKNPRTTTKK